MIKWSSFFVVALSLLFTTSGCFFDVEIDANGGGTMEVRQRLAEPGTLNNVKKQMASPPDVTVTDAKLAEDQWATFQVKFDHLTKLTAANFFKRATITESKDEKKGTTALTAKIANASPGKIAEKIVNFYGNEVVFSVTAPSEIVATNAKSKEGNKATWKYTMQEFLGTPEVLLELEYKSPQQKAGAEKAAK